ncbi:amino acid--tRNA ligase-related protein [Vibrio lentus]|uniref:amino acid--tRNA ligase-related protein n=1 Tax=Vibrio lentus TaxID=136468 RepID=UPI00178CA365|nr:amino acid--tRNA ligase-related protein [Vibrio lentus]MDN3632954.1 amino acid--tRNA ligase-related protein [Vibrio lentus]
MRSFEPSNLDGTAPPSQEMKERDFFTLEPTLFMSDLCRILRESLWNKGFMEFPTSVIRAHDCRSAVPRLEMADGRFLQDSPASALIRNLKLHPAVFSLSPCFRGDDINSTYLQKFYMLDLYKENASLDEICILFKDLISIFYRGEFEDFSVANKILVDFNIDLKTDIRGLDKFHTALSNLYEPSELLFPLMDRWITEEVEPLSKGKCLIAYDFPYATETCAKLRAGTFLISERIEFLIEGVEVVHLYQYEPDVDKMLERAKALGHYGPEDSILSELVHSGTISPHSAGGAIGIERLCAACLGLTNIDVFLQPPEFLSQLDLPK